MMLSSETNVGVFLANSLQRNFKDPADYLFDDKSGVADGAACGGEYESIALSTTYAASTARLDIADYDSLGRKIVFLARIKASAATTIVAQPYLVIGGNPSGISVYGNEQIISITTSYNVFVIGSMAVPIRPRENMGFPIYFNIRFKTQGGTVTLHNDYQVYIDGSAIYSVNTGGALFSRYASTDNANMAIIDGDNYLGEYETEGDRVPVVPRFLNLLYFSLRSSSAAISDTTTVQSLL
jgi:hypothetical protein